MAKIITIVENDAVTGVRYGTVEIPEQSSNIKRAQKQFEKISAQKNRKIRSENTKRK